MKNFILKTALSSLHWCLKCWIKLMLSQSYCFILRRCILRSWKSQQTQWTDLGVWNPRGIKEVSCGIESILVWCAFSIDLVIESYLFDNPIVTGDSYQHLLNNYFLSMLPALQPDNIHQQDEALTLQQRGKRRIGCKTARFMDFSKRSSQ